MDLELTYTAYSQRMLNTISGLNQYAASLAAQGKTASLPGLRELMIDMCWIWEGCGSGSKEELPWDEFLAQYMGPFDKAVEQAQHTLKSPKLDSKTKEQIFYGIGIHIRELLDSCENMEQAHQWMNFAEQMNREWAGTTRYSLFYQMINGPLWEGEAFGKPMLHLPYDIIPASVVPSGWHCYHLCSDVGIRIVDQHPERGYVATIFSPYSLKSPSAPFRELRGTYRLYKEPTTLCEFCEKNEIKLPETFLEEEQQWKNQRQALAMEGMSL